jgi:hypothetical protein
MYVRSEILKAGNIVIMIFWNVMRRSVEDISFSDIPAASIFRVADEDSKFSRSVT